MNNKKTTAKDQRVIDLMRGAFTTEGGYAFHGQKLTEAKKTARVLIAEAAFEIGDKVDGHDVLGALVILCYPVNVRYGSALVLSSDI